MHDRCFCTYMCRERERVRAGGNLSKVSSRLAHLNLILSFSSYPSGSYLAHYVPWSCCRAFFLGACGGRRRWAKSCVSVCVAFCFYFVYLLLFKYIFTAFCSQVYAQIQRNQMLSSIHHYLNLLQLVRLLNPFCIACFFSFLILFLSLCNLCAYL